MLVTLEVISMISSWIVNPQTILFTVFTDSCKMFWIRLSVDCYQQNLSAFYVKWISENQFLHFVLIFMWSISK